MRCGSASSCATPGAGSHGAGARARPLPLRRSASMADRRDVPNSRQPSAAAATSASPHSSGVRLQAATKTPCAIDSATAADQPSAVANDDARAVSPQRAPGQSCRPGERGQQRCAMPVRVLDDRSPPREARVAVAVEHAPVTAHRAFQRTLPGLIEAFDQVVVDRCRARAHGELAREARLRAPARHGLGALAAGSRPAGLSHQQRRAVEALPRQRGDRQHVVDGPGAGHGGVLPVGKDVHGHDVDPGAQRLVAEPELPDVGVADRHRRRLPRAIEQRAEGLDRQLAAQQHLVADDQQVDHVGRAPRDLQRPIELGGVGTRVAAQPGAELHAHAEPPCDLGHHIETLADRIRPHAASAGAQDPEILFDPFDAHARAGVERCLARPAKRRVRHAGQCGVGRVGRRDLESALDPPDQRKR